jgi:hypothetical protein
MYKLLLYIVKPNTIWISWKCIPIRKFLYSHECRVKVNIYLPLLNWNCWMQSHFSYKFVISVWKFLIWWKSGNHVFSWFRSALFQNEAMYTQTGHWIIHRCLPTLVPGFHQLLEFVWFCHYSYHQELMSSLYINLISVFLLYLVTFSSVVM